MSFLDTIGETIFTNEAEVETRLVMPLLELLGYDNNDIRPKYPVVFREGRQGRNPETDFVVFAGPEHSKNTSLLAVEAKHPSEILADGKEQGESYAANLRAPFLIATNGRELELWQLQVSYESECVFSSPVKDLAGRFGELHRLIWKDAAVKYKNSLRQKSIVEMSNDFRSYLDSELQRTIAYEQVVPRRLSPVGSAGADTFASDQLLGDFLDGAVIVAPSGYGKTTLANFLDRQSIERAKANGSSILPFYVDLPDAAATGRTLLDYAQERVVAHCPQVSMPAFRYMLRSAGGVLLLDGFDRLASASRQTYFAELKTLRRDYRGLQIFVFSRVSSRPDVGLPLLELKEYSDREQVAYAEIVAARRDDPFRGPIGFMPEEALRSLCKVPLLLQLALAYWYEHQAFPTDLKVLFRSWIDQLLQNLGAPPSQLIILEEALSLIALRSSHGSLSGAAAINILRENGYAQTILDDLVQSDALRMVGGSLELVHEALGDYLRALRLVQMDSTSLMEELPTIELDTDSLFPVMLAAVLERHDIQQVLFRRLAQLNLAAYFDALRHRADVSAEVLSGTNEDFVRTYLQDMLDGIEEPLLAFFPQMRGEILEALVNAPARAIAVRGHGSPEGMNYCYLPAVSDQKVTVGPFSNEDRLRGSNLRLLGLRADSGRMLGLSQLKEELLDLPRRRVLKGDAEWISERLIGRIRLLNDRSGMKLDLHAPLDVFQVALRPHADKLVAPGWGSNIHFSIASILEDIDLLRERGDTHLNLWWEEYGAHDNLQRDEIKTRALLNAFYKRLQLIYKEVVERSFETVSAEFGFYTSMPVRWDLALLVPHGHQSWAPIQYRWKPVRSWDEAGADLEFAAEAPERFRHFDFQEAQVQLRDLGRLTEKSHVWAGGGMAPSFDGYSLMGGNTGETPVLTEVCEYIEDDLERLFASAPGGDIPYPEQRVQT